MGYERSLTNEIETLENKIIKYKSFELSPKLDKLNFIKSSLPKIYQRISERIYPILEGHKKDLFINNMQKILSFICENPLISIKLEDIDFSDHQNIYQIPPNTFLPNIKWQNNIGKQKWKNTPLILGDDIFVGSAGREWNISDEADGVYCLNIHTGRIKWFYPTQSDVNQISFYDGLIFGGCDNGKFFCISSQTGKEKFSIFLDSGIVSSVYKGSCDNYIVVTYTGKIYEIFIGNDDEYIVGILDINCNIMGDISYLRDDQIVNLYIPTLCGKIYHISNHQIFNYLDPMGDNSPLKQTNKRVNDFSKKETERFMKKNFSTLYIKNEFQVEYPDEHSETKYSIAKLYSKPLVIQDKIYQAFIRHTYYDYPPIICINKSSGKIEWIAQDLNNVSESNYGNIRTELINFNNEIIFIHPYSNELVGISQENGQVLWATKLGRKMFQQWSSPIIYKNNIYVARHDGYLYKVNGITKKREWGMYLCKAENAGVVFNDEQTLVHESEATDWNISKGFSFFATPSIVKGNLTQIAS